MNVLGPLANDGDDDEEMLVDLLDYTITPLLAPNAPEEISFNVAHKRTRCIVDRALGLLKARWRILLVKCDYQPLIASDIIRACCILHNISLQ